MPRSARDEALEEFGDYFGEEAVEVFKRLMGTYGHGDSTQQSQHLPGTPPRGVVGGKPKDVAGPSALERREDEILDRIIKGDRAGAEALRTDHEAPTFAAGFVGGMEGE